MLRLPAVLRLPSKFRRRARRRRMATLLCLLLLLLLFVLPFYIIYKPPNLLIRYFAHRWPDVLWQVDTDKKIVALTLDDAPSEYTPRILELLEANDAHATFFVIGGQVSGREEMLADVVRAGNELGNHAMHDEASRALSDDELTAQINEVREKIRAAYSAAARSDGDAPTATATTTTDMPNQYFRPGSGFFSDRMRALLDRLGYRLVLGSVYPHDPQIGWWRVNAAHVLSMVRPGAIIINHDRRPWTVPMLATVLPELRRRGFRVVSVSQLLEETGAG